MRATPLSSGDVLVGPSPACSSVLCGASGLPGPPGSSQLGNANYPPLTARVPSPSGACRVKHGVLQGESTRDAFGVGWSGLKGGTKLFTGTALVAGVAAAGPDFGAASPGGEGLVAAAGFFRGGASAPFTGLLSGLACDCGALTWAATTSSFLAQKAKASSCRSFRTIDWTNGGTSAAVMEFPYIAPLCLDCTWLFALVRLANFKPHLHENRGFSTRYCRIRWSSVVYDESLLHFKDLGPARVELLLQAGVRYHMQ